MQITKYPEKGKKAEGKIIEMAKKLEELKPDGIIAADGGVIEMCIRDRMMDY